MIRNVWTIANVFMKYARTNPGFYFLQVVFFPVSILVPFALVSREGMLINIFVGSAICSTTIMTIADISDIISHDRYSKAISYFTTRPLHQYEYIAGLGLSTLVYNLFGITTIFVCGVAFLDIRLSVASYLVVFFLTIVGWLVASCIGFLLGMWGPRDPRLNTAIASILAYTLTFLSPIYYPIEALPPILQTISKFFYTTDLAILAKATAAGSSLPVGPLMVVVGYVVVSVSLLLRFFRWNTET